MSFKKGQEFQTKLEKKKTKLRYFRSYIMCIYNLQQLFSEVKKNKQS